MDDDRTIERIHATAREAYEFIAENLRDREMVTMAVVLVMANDSMQDTDRHFTASWIGTLNQTSQRKRA